MDYIALTILIINIVLIGTMMFIERRKPEVIISWLVILTFVPILGFLFYIIFGSGLSLKTRRMLKRKIRYEDTYESFVWKELLRLPELSEEERELALFNERNAKSLPYFDNDIQVFTFGREKIEALKKDLLNAKHSINMEYYIFDDEGVGKEIMQILCDKAREGIKVKLIFDSVGCIRAPRRFFKKLKKVGGEVAEFFPPLFGIRLINFKMNYRNHRKIVVIDGRIGYVGGINIRDDHMGLKKKLSPWRDTHLRIEGNAVYGLQNAFFNDFFFCKRKHISSTELVALGYFPKMQKCGNVTTQIVCSGPESKIHYIKESYMKMISMAKSKIILQTPYLVPDDVFMAALKQAIKSGVKVIIMLPRKPDKRFVYLATLSFARELVECGAEIYLYNGFLHSKLLIVDDLCVSVGTCNADNRSFALNFEINAFMYNKNFIKMCYDILNEDLNNSMQIDLTYFKQKRFTSKLGQTFFRMFAPLL